jgi:hypothetical protein
MGQVDGDGPVGGPGRPIVEADKAFVGGRDKRGKDDKTVVLGVVERGGEVVTRVIPDKSEQSVGPAIEQIVVQGARLATDEARAFMRLSEYGFQHATVNHKALEFVRGNVHTNTVEGFWNLFKAAYRGTYVWVSAKHLQTYLHEFEYRWNLRRHAHLMLPVLLQAFAKPERRTPSLSASGQSVA